MRILIKNKVLYSTSIDYETQEYISVPNDIEEGITFFIDEILSKFEIKGKIETTNEEIDLNVCLTDEFQKFNNNKNDAFWNHCCSSYVNGIMKISNSNCVTGLLGRRDKEKYRPKYTLVLRYKEDLSISDEDLLKEIKKITNKLLSEVETFGKYYNSKGQECLIVEGKFIPKNLGVKNLEDMDKFEEAKIDKETQDTNIAMYHRNMLWESESRLAAYEERMYNEQFKKKKTPTQNWGPAFEPRQSGDGIILVLLVILIIYALVAL